MAKEDIDSLLEGLGFIEGEELVEEAKAKATAILKTAIFDAGKTMKGGFKKWGVKAAATKGTAKGIQVRVWIDGPEDEARDIAKIVLGPKHKLVPHKLKANYFVATAEYSLSDIF